MRTKYVQNSFLSGVLDPRAAGRIDTDAYNNGLLTGTNVVPVHLGGVRRRGGLRYVDTLPNALTRVASGITITAPNGGTTANANDDDVDTLLETTAGVSTNDPYVVVHYDLGSAKSILYADVRDIAADIAQTSDEFRIQYSTDDSTWTDFGSAFPTVDIVNRSYRRGGTAVSARYWRVAKVGGTNMSTAAINLGEFNLWQDAGTVSNVRILPFELTTEDQYQVVLTDRNVSVYKDDTLILQLPSPYAHAEIADVDAVVGAESLFMVHEDHPPQYIYRESATDFQIGAVEFRNVPKVDFNDGNSPTPTSEVQVITFSDGWIAGDTFQIELEGARTGAIAYAGDSSADEQAATAAAIERAVQKLYTVPGYDGVSVSRTDEREYTVTFADASAKAYELMTVIPLVTDGTATATATITRSIAGVSREEDVWSDTRGYPRTVTFFEGRLYFGGTRSNLQSVIGSAVNDIVNFKIGEGLDADPIFVTLNGQQLNAINGLFSGRSLQLFTSGGEFRYVKAQGSPITPSDAPVNQTQYGAAKIRPVMIDGATIFVQRTRKAIRDFRYNYEEDAYDSLGVSSLASHLINGVVDITAWKGSSTDEINLVFVVNGDGTVAVFNSRKEANVQAWTYWTTDGLFKAAAATLEDIHFAVRRTINGTDYLFLERYDDTLYTDSAVQRSAAATDTITGLDHLNGEECRVRADGYVLNNVTPSGGSATIEAEAEDVEIGLNFNPEVTPMPLSTMVPDGSTFMSKRRVVKARAKVRNTLGLLLNGRPLPDRYYDVDNFDEAAEPFTGIHALEETTNWDETEDKTITFTQVDPLPMEILAIEVEMESA